jgi:CDP-diacylglycerol---glycerol-3-phosphate 3-phosphatidyltransferase|uniref:phosphatidylinositol phosphate synthase n=1 Tax=Candidatus Planktophila sp. TaxID=2175601 RepID=UPI004049D157
MISDIFKPAVVRLISPTARGLLRIGLTPNSVTTIGAIGVIATSLIAYPNGHLFGGTVAICCLALSDLFDGTMARLSQQGPSRWGGFLDSTIDRVTDSAIALGLLIYLAQNNDALSFVLLVSIVSGFLVSYIRAKAESLQIECKGGFAERTERLIILLTAIGFTGLGVEYILTVGIWALALASVVTVLQRLRIVWKATK